MKLDYYKILEVEPTSSADEIRRAYRRLAWRYLDPNHQSEASSSGSEYYHWGCFTSYQRSTYARRYTNHASNI
ncbi:MAG: DnaJ domain-containing protein [bacterium]|nr:DnaJ domain-containing protein [bacterium]